VLFGGIEETPAVIAGSAVLQLVFPALHQTTTFVRRDLLCKISTRTNVTSHHIKLYHASFEKLEIRSEERDICPIVTLYSLEAAFQRLTIL